MTLLAAFLGLVLGAVCCAAVALCRATRAEARQALERADQALLRWQEAVARAERSERELYRLDLDVDEIARRTGVQRTDE